MEHKLAGMSQQNFKKFSEDEIFEQKMKKIFNLLKYPKLILAFYGLIILIIDGQLAEDYVWKIMFLQVVVLYLFATTIQTDTKIFKTTEVLMYVLDFAVAGFGCIIFARMESNYYPKHMERFQFYMLTYVVAFVAAFVGGCLCEFLEI